MNQSTPRQLDETVQITEGKGSEGLEMLALTRMDTEAHQGG